MRKSKKLILLLLVFVTMILGIVYFPKIMDLINYECFYKKYFNIICAGCGFTRMLSAFGHLDFYKAFRFNPLLFIFLILGIIYIIYIFICVLLNKKYYKIKPRDGIILFIILVIYMILRNIPGFSYLKPTTIMFIL